MEDIICPVDFYFTNEHLIGATQFRSLFKKVKHGVEFIWVADSCFSGKLVKLLNSGDTIFISEGLCRTVGTRLSAAQRPVKSNLKL